MKKAKLKEALVAKHNVFIENANEMMVLDGAVAIMDKKGFCLKTNGAHLIALIKMGLIEMERTHPKNVLYRIPNHLRFIIEDAKKPNPEEN